METFRTILEISALIFFNAFSILGVVAFATIIISVSKTKQKFDETMDYIQSAAFSVTETAKSLTGLIPFKREKQEPIWASILKKFF